MVAKGRGIEEMDEGVKEYKLSVIEWISSGDIMCSTVTTVNIIYN